MRGQIGKTLNKNVFSILYHQTKAPIRKLIATLLHCKNLCAHSTLANPKIIHSYCKNSYNYSCIINVVVKHRDAAACHCIPLV